MKREEKNALTRQRILDAAVKEFSEKGYSGASLNTVCAEKGISKGIIYHYFKDKDELYLVCVQACFDELTQYLEKQRSSFTGSLEEKLQSYFDKRFHFFAENPLLLGLFADAAFSPPASLTVQIADCRKDFDEFSISILTDFLKSEPIRNGLTLSAIVEDFRDYIDYFNMKFAGSFGQAMPTEPVLREHEERCHRQLNMLLYGVLGDKHENQSIQ